MAENIKKENTIPGFDTFENFTKEGFKVLMEAIRNSNALPVGGDWNFYNAYESFSSIMNNEGNEILNSINVILRKYEVDGNIKNRSSEEKTELIVEANDVILENVANHIDEMNGIKKNPVEPVVMQTVSAQLPINGSWNAIDKATFSVTSSNAMPAKGVSSQQAIRLLTGKNIIRPQKFFKDKIDNSNNPWEPRIKIKPNLLKPLAIFLEATENGEEFSHPYEFELERFNPLPEQLREIVPIKPKPIEDTPLIEVVTEEQLESLLNDLQNYTEFAVDLEHHSYRSFMGITCLMQVSTKDTDYLIDTLALRDKLFILNEVFTKPSIVKIFHGGDMDIQWLQRDLSLYVVNMFDTYQAAKVLGYSGLSLSYLLNKFCNFTPNKHFQLADWRIRPLPDQLKSYAREDTHYLIYIYQVLTNRLLKNANGKDNLLRSVYQRSTEICKKRYVKPILREDSHIDFYRKCKRLFNNRQLYALKELYKWRDQICREEDESTGYVLPNHMLLQISEILPREMQGILACCNPIPPLVRANLLELHQIILRAREQPLEKPIMKEDNRERGSAKQSVKINIDSQLHCPHDLSKLQEFRDDLPTLLGNASEHLNKTNLNEDNIFAKASAKLEIESIKSTLSVFDSPENSEEEDESVSPSKLKQLKFLGPYERYKLVKPFIKAEEEKAAEKLSTEESTKEPTLDDRIAALHTHFVEAAKAVPQKLTGKSSAASEQTAMYSEEPRSLLAMGGSKKRKHEYLEDDCVDCQGSSESFNEYLPIPRGQYKTQNQNSGRGKRKRSASQPNNKAKMFKPNDQQQWAFNQNQDNQSSNKKQRNRSKLWKSRNKKQQNKGANVNIQNNQAQQHNVQQHINVPQNHQQNNQQHKTRQQNKQYNQPQQNQQQMQQNKQHNQMQKNKRRNRMHQNKQQCNQMQQIKKRQNQDNYQQQNNFNSYDYSSVDFRQFQGGAGEVSKPKPVKTAFKNRGRKRNRGGNNNKSFTFGNERGRGRNN